MNRSEYRDAMARFGAAVSVITTQDEEGPAGFTASAVCSVTDEPPTLLVCMNRGSRLNERFKRTGILCVNALCAAQQDLSPMFAGLTAAPMPDRFAAAQWDRLATGAPVLQDALVSFDCKIAQVTEIGTHSVFFCAVQAVRLGEGHQGLIYFGRAYHSVTRPHGAENA